MNTSDSLWSLKIETAVFWCQTISHGTPLIYPTLLFCPSTYPSIPPPLPPPNPALLLIRAPGSGTILLGRSLWNGTVPVPPRHCPSISRHGQAEPKEIF
uniref:Uncharacterized protein n=1 Tax=Knipowitschia caucasica TaxID=637954 RepID=A0AAV2KEZ2_KNICA